LLRSGLDARRFWLSRYALTRRLLLPPNLCRLRALDLRPRLRSRLSLAARLWR
jgi:hypothetical protein